MGYITKCGLCGSENLQSILNMGEQPLSEGYGTYKTYPLELVRCWDCLLFQLNYIVDQEDMFPASHPYTTGTTKRLVDHFHNLAAELATELGPDDVVVDIGANDGTLLSGYPAGLRKVAIEPTGQAAKCRDKGFITYQKFFTAELASLIAGTVGTAKVITATNVFAHVPDPHDFLEGVETLLDDNGRFVTENHLLSSLTDGLQFDFIYHEHVRYYSIETLSRLLGMHGFQVESAIPIAIHGGSFRTIASKRHHSDFGIRADLAASKLTALVREAPKPIYGIGAATRAVSLMYFARITDSIMAVVEVPESEKIGQHMPGTSIPIIPEDSLINDQPPTALIFPWHLAEQLAAKYRRLGYEGQFIVALPEPRIYG